MKKNLRLSIVVLVFFNIAYFQECNQNNWQQFSPNLEYCNLEIGSYVTSIYDINDCSEYS